MSAALAPLEPRLFPLDEGSAGPTLEFVVLQAIADPGVAPCPVCDGHLEGVAGGVRCEACGSEIQYGADEPGAWVA